jgi:hypothetical protein
MIALQQWMVGPCAAPQVAAGRREEVAVPGMVEQTKAEIRFAPNQLARPGLA